MVRIKTQRNAYLLWLPQTPASSSPPGPSQAPGWNLHPHHLEPEKVKGSSGQATSATGFMETVRAKGNSVKATEEGEKRKKDGKGKRKEGVSVCRVRKAWDRKRKDLEHKLQKGKRGLYALLNRQLI